MTALFYICAWLWGVNFGADLIRHDLGNLVIDIVVSLAMLALAMVATGQRSFQ